MSQNGRRQLLLGKDHLKNKNMNTQRRQILSWSLTLFKVRRGRAGRRGRL